MFKIVLGSLKLPQSAIKDTIETHEFQLKSSVLKDSVLAVGIPITRTHSRVSFRVDLLPRDSHSRISYRVEVLLRDL